MTSAFLGIEIGGTKLQVAIGPGDGSLDRLWRYQVAAQARPQQILDKIVAAVQDLLHPASPGTTLAGGAVGFGGPVDDSGAVVKSHQVAGWDRFPLAAWLREVLKLPIALANDAEVAGLAEARFGAGRGISPLFYITVGSGVGGGLLIGGEIYRGSGRGAGEIGHLPFLQSQDGVHVQTNIEGVASGWAMANEARRRLAHAAKRSSLLEFLDSGPEGVTAADVGQAAAQGDPLARGVLDQAIMGLAAGIGHVLILLAPRRIVIGGGVSLMGDLLFFEPLRAAAAAWIEDRFPPFAGTYDIVPAALGETVVVHGALALARSRFGAAAP